jgi:hypothetical protein
MMMKMDDDVDIRIRNRATTVKEEQEATDVCYLEKLRQRHPTLTHSFHATVSRLSRDEED